ncbi:MAG: hypothetical protein PVG57_08880 [Gammaproteobacteria bacterium]|jgi:TolB-like protein/Flp pilus assembly protein TadD
MSSFFSELKRRNVIRVAVLYTVVAWVLIQVVDIVMPRLGIPEWGVTFVIVILGVGFPVALIFAWAFELTPEGIKRTRDVDPQESITPVTGQKINHLVIGVLAVAVAYLLVDKFFLASGPDASKPEIAATGQPTLTSIAVLPFADMSPAKDQEYFTDGISEELLNLLAKIPDFKVAGRTSSFAFKNKNEDLRVIGEKLGVSTILEGSVRKQENQIRVTAQLVKVDDGYHLWSETYDRQLDDVFAIQDEIATEVVGALKQTLLGEDDKIVIASAPRTQNTEAYTAYLRGRHVMRVRSEENLYKALREFRHATEVDPEFAPAWAGVANAYSLLGNYEYRAETEVLPLASDAVDKALLLNPDLAEGWAARGLLLMQKRAAAEESIPVLERAVALNPGNAETLMWLGSQLRNANRFEEAWAAYQQAYEVDPLFPVLLSNLATSSVSRGDAAAADRYLSELQSVAPDALTTYRARVLTAWNLGELEQSFRILSDGVESGADDVFMINLLADRHLDYGESEEAVRLAGRARQINPLSAWATSVEASKLYLEGKQDTAVALVEEALVRQPDEEILRLSAGLWARLADDTKASREHLERGLKSDAQARAWVVDNPDALFIASFLIDIYRESGDAEAAQALYETATRYNLNSAWGGEGSWWDNYLQAWVEGAIGNVEAMKMRLTAAAGQGGQSTYWGPWGIMITRHTNDPEVAEQLQRLDARRREIAQALAADGLIGESASEPAG